MKTNITGTEGTFKAIPKTIAASKGIPQQSTIEPSSANIIPPNLIILLLVK